MVVDGLDTAQGWPCRRRGLAVIPTTDGEAGSVIQGSGFGIAKTCADKDGAFQNIMKITTPEVIGTVGRTRGTVPSVESVVVDWAEDKQPGDLEAVQAMLAGGGPLITTPSWNQVRLEQVRGRPPTATSPEEIFQISSGRAERHVHPSRVVGVAEEEAVGSDPGARISARRPLCSLYQLTTGPVR